MNRDPIVEEVRRVRAEYAKEHGYDLKRIFADLRARQEARLAKAKAKAPARSDSAKGKGRAKRKKAA